MRNEGIVQALYRNVNFASESGLFLCHAFSNRGSARPSPMRLLYRDAVFSSLWRTRASSDGPVEETD